MNCDVTWVRVWRPWDRSFGWIPIWVLDSAVDAKAGECLAWIWTVAEKKKLLHGPVFNEYDAPAKPLGYIKTEEDAAAEGATVREWLHSDKSQWVPQWAKD